MASYEGTEPQSAPTSEYNLLDFIVRQVAGGMMTSTDVIVRAVGVDANGYPTVDVQPMVHQIDGAGTVMPHGIIHGLPVHRMQGGACAVIVTPAVGDIGTAVFAREDTTSARVNRAPSPPGSRRRYAYPDGVYFGGHGNPVPLTLINLMADGTVAITAPSKITITAPETHVEGMLFNNGVLVGSTHEHGMVQSGTSNSGPPVP